MKAAVVKKPGRLEIVEIPEPAINDYQALAEILACATCSSTDIKLIEGKIPFEVDYPGVLGHESVGRVVKIGKKVENLKVGDMVLRPTAVYPGERIGKYFSIWGGYAEYGIVTDTEALMRKEGISAREINGYAFSQQKVPATISPEDATMLITFKECLSWLQDIGLKPLRSVLIIGDGPVSLSFTRFAKIMGAKPVIVCGHHQERLEKAEREGADFVINSHQKELSEEVKEITRGKGVDFFIDAVGDLLLLREATRLISDGGKIGVYGTPPAQRAEINWSAAPPHWSMHFSYGGEKRVHEQVIDAVRLGLIEPQHFYTHIIPLERIKEAFELLKTREAYKVVIKMKSLNER